MTKSRTGITLLAAIALSAGAEARLAAPASAWQIGPVIDGRSHSLGAIRPVALRGGLAVTISPTSEPHYVTFRHGSLRGNSQIRMRYRVDAPVGTSIYGARCPMNSAASVTLYFQRSGDDWATDGARWWATFASVPLNGPSGEHELVASLNGPWTSVQSMTAANSPDEFADAKAFADRVGFTFGNCEGYGHGARATAPARFIVTSFEVR